MNTLNVTSGASGGLSVDFSLQSCGPIPVENKRNLKLCVLCLRYYLHTPLSMARECPDCEKLEAARREAMNRPLDIPDPRAPAERVDWKQGGRKRATTPPTSARNAYQREYRARNRGKARVYQQSYRDREYQRAAKALEAVQ